MISSSTGQPGVYRFTRLREKGKQGHVLKEMKQTDREKGYVFCVILSSKPTSSLIPLLPRHIKFSFWAKVSRNHFHTDILYTQLYEHGSAVQLSLKQALLLTNI